MKVVTKLVAVVAVTVIIGAGALGLVGRASAQQPAPTPSSTQTNRQQYRAAFFAKLAADLNVSVDQIRSAFKDAGLQLVDELQSDGTITADQAAKIREHINTGKGFGLGALFRPYTAQQARVALRREVVKSASLAIGVDARDLAKELRRGKSIADVAGEHNVSLDAVTAQIQSDAKSKLDRAVANGKLTQANEDAALQKLADNLDSILNKHREQ